MTLAVLIICWKHHWILLAVQGFLFCSVKNGTWIDHSTCICLMKVWKWNVCWTQVWVVCLVPTKIIRCTCSTWWRLHFTWIILMLIFCCFKSKQTWVLWCGLHKWSAILCKCLIYHSIMFLSRALWSIYHIVAYP